MRKKYGVIILLLCLLSCFPYFVTGKTKPPTGIVAMTLGPTYPGVVSAERLLTDSQNVLKLDRFYRLGGENLPVTPTECYITHQADTLYVLFQCREDQMQFPAITRGNWYSTIYSPPEQDALFPDKVDLFILPDMNHAASYYQFAVTLDGSHFGSKCIVSDEIEQADGQKIERKYEKAGSFEATLIRHEKEWLALMRIPWSAIGGKPNGFFGLMPVRSRWRNGEVSSPVALDFTDRPATDLFIETQLGEKPAVIPAGEGSNGVFCLLPSGIWRWQRPALLGYPDEETKAEILKLQQSLHLPTNESNLGRRIFLTQQWTDLMILEGFNFGSTRGSIVEEDMYPSVLRTNVNRALREKNPAKACALVDDYLLKLDAVSRKWFADGSTGNILDEEWKTFPKWEIEKKENVLLLHGMATSHATGTAGEPTVNRIDLHLSFPQTGGVRLCNRHEGHFKPDALLPFTLMSEQDKYLINADGQKVVIRKNSFQVILYEATGKEVLRIDLPKIAFRMNDKGEIIAVDFKNHLEKEEVIFGFGERYDRLDQRGQVLTLWGMDDWIGLTVGLRNQTYKPIPVFHSSRGYTVFINSSYRLRADIGKTNPEEYRLTQHGPVFDYFFWTCPPEKALQSYTDLTGKPLLPPKWAFEPWMGRTGRGWNAPAGNPVAEQKRVMNRFAELDIPHSALYAEGIGANMPELHTWTTPLNIRILSWFYSSIPQKIQEDLMPEVKPTDLPVLRVDNPRGLPPRDISYVDFSHPHAKELSRRWWKLRLDLGVAGSMVDFGDRVPEDAVFYNGKKGDEMHNFYAYDYHKIYHEVFKERRGDDFILFGRSAAPGTQKWVAQFPGDHSSNFRGLQSVLRGALNISACGFSTWGSDLGGFRGWPEPEVYIRWTQFSCFSPLMRAHGRTPREPWEFGKTALSNYKHYTWVRENLLDYVYHSAAHTHQTGVPMIRSMAVSFPGQPSMAAIDDQYMFGRELLVAPVVTEDHSRTIAFPEGKWTDLWTGEVFMGPTRVQKEVPIETIPVYLKEGAVVPVRLNGDLQFGESMTGNQVNAIIVTPPNDQEKMILFKEHDEQASVTLRTHTDSSFTITLDNLPEMLYLIVYDTSFTQVKANDNPLPLLTGKELQSLPPGWFTDPVVKRTIIRLPRNRIHEVTLMK